ncbi:MAG: uracil-DNA glycosylase family protein [Magnetospirillum sp.]|nr:uracil-DNA glycosylase family protein [Magnetospirillum sp.]
MTTLDDILAAARACTLCAPHLPLGPRPVLRASATARLLIIGQAPGTRVHETGIPWNDRSGQRLRHWLALDEAIFYDESRVAILPTGLCYPGRAANGGDLPPRPECAPLWHPKVMALMPDIRLILLVGSYAQAFVLGNRRRPTMTETVRDHPAFGPLHWPLPHPSWRTNAWEKANPWFGEQVLPALRQRIGEVLAQGPA